MFILNTLLGFIIAQLYDILRREKSSSASPQHFDIGFFWRDTKLKLILSLILSITIALAVHFNFDDAAKLFSTEMDLNNLVYLLIGSAPELVLQLVKKRTSFLQPENVDGYKRKTEPKP